MTCTCQPKEIRPASREVFFAPLRSLGYESHEVQATWVEHGGVYVTRYTTGADGEQWRYGAHGIPEPVTETVFHPFDDMQDDAPGDTA